MEGRFSEKLTKDDMGKGGGGRLTKMISAMILQRASGKKSQIKGNYY